MHVCVLYTLCLLYVYVEARDWYSSIDLYLSSSDRVLYWIELAALVNCFASTGQICCYLYPNWSARVTDVYCDTEVLCGQWQSEFRSLCLNMKHFTHWAICLAQTLGWFRLYYVSPGNLSLSPSPHLIPFPPRDRQLK